MPADLGEWKNDLAGTTNRDYRGSKVEMMRNMMKLRLLLVMLATPLLLLGCGRDEPESVAVAPDPVMPTEAEDRTDAREDGEVRPVSAEPQEEGEAPFVMPALSESDQLVREQARNLTGHALLASYLVPRDLITRFVVLVDNVADGKVPRQHVAALGPSGNFAAAQMAETSYVLDERSYNRYDPLIAVFTSLDLEAALSAYELLQPLFQEAYEQLGGSGSFESRVGEAIDHLLAAPVIEYPIRLSRPSVMYVFSDEALESLSDAQKQLIRMGPNNTRALQEKLREFRLQIG